MAKGIKATGLARIEITPTGEKDSVALVMVDTGEEATGYLINPEGLNVLLEPLLGLATQWADQPDLKIEDLTGPQHALPAQRILFMRGRHDKECAVRVYIGKVELTFLIPIDNVISATADLVRMVDPDFDKKGPSH